ncbi:tetratricopeptide repeat protein [Yoonia sp. 2307UL14-13]|uniref:tetratricopeptide repeat protein n=1 Tax=Yoonia sp. 2307UL14-13 TaxID=3126506 RepID=UPI0030A3B7F2
MRLATLAVVLTPFGAFAAGSADPKPPAPTETTENCPEGQIWDLATQSCMSPEDSTNDDSARLDDVRALAYRGHYAAAFDILNSITDTDDSLVLTYYGFLHRQTGDIARGMAFYDAALAQDANNLLARSYMGQGHVTSGRMALAQTQLVEIRIRGGRGSWSETSLAQAIETGATVNY